MKEKEVLMTNLLKLRSVQHSPKAMPIALLSQQLLRLISLPKERRI